jgi:hypothetical protein
LLVVHLSTAMLTLDQWLLVDKELTRGLQPAHLAKVWNRYVEQVDSPQFGQQKTNQDEVKLRMS